MKLFKMFLAGLLFIPLVSCEKSDEVDTVEIATDLILDFVVSSEITDIQLLKTSDTESGYLFSGTGIFNLAQNDDLGKTFLDVKKVKPDNGCILSLSEITDENEIYSLLLKWGSKSNILGEFEMENEIDITSLVKEPKNGNLEIDLSGIIIPFVNIIDRNPDFFYKVDVIGTSNFDISSTAKLKIPVLVETNVYPTKFTLF